MRIWEVEENKAILPNLVREQDFILRIRSLYRQGGSYLIVNVTLSTIDPAHGGRGPLEEAQERLNAFANNTAGKFVAMSNGDVFIIWPSQAAPADPEIAAIQTGLPLSGAPDDDKAYVLTYRLPEDYTSLRERTNHYVEVLRGAMRLSDETSAGNLLLTEAARGPLTAWSVDQIHKVIQDIDLRRYLKVQPVYERLALGTWRPTFEEWFVSLEELRRAHFPKLDLVPSDHLFFGVCQALDGRLLGDLTNNASLVSKNAISINLSLETVMGSNFATLARVVPQAQHENIIIEINCGDLLQDFSRTLNALAALRHERFRMAIDGVTPDMLRFIKFGAFDVDFVKLNVSRERFVQLGDIQTREALMNVPREKLVFYRCDNESAYTLGLSIGVTKFQGWYMDDVIKGREKS